MIRLSDTVSRPAPSGNRFWPLAMLVAAILAIMTLFCITTLFNTKGEPREAVVALSMLQSGDWILPLSFGGEEMPYKPPMLAWCIALASWLFTGWTGEPTVTEFTSRVPSLVAAIWLTVATARFFMKEGAHGVLAGIMTGWITITSLEVFRAATACRVDMVLTAFMVSAMMHLYTFHARNTRGGLPWLAILAMSGACLTKGPVGILIPCMVVGIYRLFQSDRFWPLAWRLALSGLLALILPAAWYFLAYGVGGERFLDLAIEENFGRFTGSMSYESHENPISYNFVMLAAGMVPYTLLAIIALSRVRWRSTMYYLSGYAGRTIPIAKVSSFALTATLTIFIFFCIPKSKRSVYLLPMYPFVAWGVTLLMHRLSQSRRGRDCARWFGGIFGVLAILLPPAWIYLRWIADPDKFASFQPLWMQIVSAMLGVLSVIIGAIVLRTVCSRTDFSQWKGLRCFIPSAVGIFACYMVLDNAILPPILSAKSDIVAAEEFNRLQPEGPVWTWVSAPMLRFYTANMYLDGRVRQVRSSTPGELPPSGTLLLVGQADLDILRQSTGRDFTVIWSGKRRSCDIRQIPLIVRVGD